MKRKSPSTVRPPEIRFPAFVAKHESGCWIWTGAKVGNGYGRFNAGNNRSVAAHRYSWERVNGPVPEGMLVCHTCDNRACVNPDHLFLGTPKDNTRDMLEKQRHSRGKAHGDKIRFSAKKERKLTVEQVALIKRQLSMGHPQRRIAEAFGVCQRTVSMIHNGITWTHVHG